MKILVVDDNADDRKLLRYLIEGHGSAVKEACDGMEALEQIRLEKPDLVISDGLMPGMDGFQLLRNLKKNDAYKFIPFVFYSAVYTGHNEAELALSLGAAAFIVKPKDPPELWQEIIRIIRNSRSVKEFKRKKITPEDQDFLQKYNFVVVAKLEDKVQELTREISIRKKVEEDLRRSEERYRTIAFENEMLYKQIGQLLVSTINALAAAIDAKSHWTIGHSERVTKYALDIGKELGLNGKDMEDLRLCGLLHDIGKIGIYENILNKEGELTPDERNMIKEHPVKGAEILKPITQLADIVPGVLSHHERFDGHGYPQGIAGKDIFFYSRILCVADSFDSMTADRPYRHSPGLGYAVSELKRCSGRQFDPDIVQAFLKVLHKD